MRRRKSGLKPKKKQVTIEIKEIKLRPRIGEHDLQIKIKAMREFLAEGDKIKVSLRFRGREMMHQEVGWQLSIRCNSIWPMLPRLKPPASWRGCS
jgi:translation initiation factor IF-3